MAVDLAAAEDKVERGELEEYYGFDPDSEYVIRARNRDYSGVSQRYYQFVGGQCIAPRMRADADEEQKWNRGERLSWFLTAPGYVLYSRGEEPPRSSEPLWAHLEAEDSVETGEADTGELPAPPATWPAAKPKNEPKAPRMDAKGRPVTSYPVATEGDSGEAAPTPEVRTARPRSARAVATANPPTANTAPESDGEAQGDDTGEQSSADDGPSFAFPQA